MRPLRIRVRENNLHIDLAMVRALQRGPVTKRPWGRFTTYIANSNGVTVKIIMVNPGQRLSLQYHSKRSERWICLEGDAFVEINSRKRVLRPAQEAEVPVGAKHRLSAGPLGTKVLEISQGIFEEDDVVRLEDDYGRV
jgi:mannose-6-phosphate isomerase-like protein (cupin superfamily)